jgi:hypothetical protein
MLFLPASIQISVGSDEILLQIGIFNINTLLGLGLGIGLVHLLVYSSVYTSNHTKPQFLAQPLGLYDCHFVCAYPPYLWNGKS